jgi:hypothetical protein
MSGKLDPDRVWEKLDQIENKLDDYAGRMATLEEAMRWMRGHLNFATAVFVAVVGSFSAWYLTR